MAGDIREIDMTKVTNLNGKKIRLVGDDGKGYWIEKEDLATVVGELIGTVTNDYNGLYNKEDYKRNNKIAIDKAEKLLRIVELGNTDFISCKLNYISNSGYGSINISIINHNSSKKIIAKLLYGDNIIKLYSKGSIGLGNAIVLYAKITGTVSGLLCSEIITRYNKSVDLVIDSSVNEQDLNPIEIQI